YPYAFVDGTHAYAEVLPGYSIILADDRGLGFVLAFGAGLAMDVTARAVVNVGAGYEMGFQKFSSRGDKTTFVRVTLGGGYRFLRCARRQDCDSTGEFSCPIRSCTTSCSCPQPACLPGRPARCPRRRQFHRWTAAAWQPRAKPMPTAIRPTRTSTAASAPRVQPSPRQPAAQTTAKPRSVFSATSSPTARAKAISPPRSRSSPP